MRHVVLGAGGIGGLLAAVLARTGEDVTLVMRRPSAQRHPGSIAVRSVVFGNFTAGVEIQPEAPSDGEVLWVAVKSTGLTSAMELADPDRIGDPLVVPLLNGIDHVGALRSRYRTVCPGAIRVESHRISPGVIDQRSRFAHLAVASGNGIATRNDPAIQSRVVAALEPLAAGGFGTSTSSDETSLLWEKLAFLAPIALATAAYDAPLGSVRDDPIFLQCQLEAVTTAQRDGAAITLDAVRDLTNAASAELRSSMQIDVSAGREPELDAIAGAIIRRYPHQNPPATTALAARIRARLPQPPERNLDDRLA